jgi:hypothetical protein
MFMYPFTGMSRHGRSSKTLCHEYVQRCYQYGYGLSVNRIVCNMQRVLVKLLFSLLTLRQHMFWSECETLAIYNVNKIRSNHCLAMKVWLIPFACYKQSDWQKGHNRIDNIVVHIHDIMFCSISFAFRSKHMLA